MTRHLSGACLVLVLLGISGGTTNARILGSREHRKFSQQGRDLEPDNIINARSPNGHIAGAVGVSIGIATPPTHNGVTFHEGGIVVNVITSGEGSNVHVQEPGHAPAFPPVHSPAHSPAVIPFQSQPRIPVPVQSAGHSPSPIPFQLAAEPPGTTSIPLSSAAAVQTAPFAIPTTRVQQANIAADACDCQCLCPFHFFGIPAVNLATSVDPGGVLSPTTLVTVASPSIPEVPNFGTATAAPFFPLANGTEAASVAFPTLPDIQTSSTTALPVAPIALPDIQTSSTTALPVVPIALPEPTEDSIVTAGGALISPVGDAATGIVEFVTPNEPAPPTPTETVSSNADITQPAATEADVTQPAGAEATATAADVVPTQEDPDTITDADFTQVVTGNVDFSATVTNEAAQSDADSTQTGITPAQVETPAPEAGPAAAETFDINTMTLHSALTLRLGG
ncbi:hypothetical protein EMCG_07637 [[Emmonsia] crescens]|uniref:Uncharacterized protein n=1 Tax=[Emmonsia] crescens TaxID=73230 RepID=A0A0G2I8T9_9EURO|nr:hypothetical protein EMCG_07637 [Emmonsia crescens UAMH 3008]